MRTENQGRAPIAGDGVIHPAQLTAIAALLLNDHVWKAAWPGVVTGKISDFAGLAFFPSLLVGAWEITCAALKRPFKPSRGVLFTAAIATALVFSLVKLWPPAGTAYRLGWAAMQWPFLALAALGSGRSTPALHPVALVQDPTDLVALPAIAVAVWTGLGRVRRRAPGQQGR